MSQTRDPLVEGILRKVAQSTSHKLATVDTPKGAGPGQQRISELVKEAKFWQEQAANSRDFHGRQLAGEKVAAIAAELRGVVGLDDETIIRKFAERLPLQTAAATIVRKAASVDSTPFAMTPELAKTIRGAVNKAFEDLGTRIEALNERAAGLPRKRL